MEHPPAYLSCRHIVGYQCILFWLKSRNDANRPSCPICRAGTVLRVQSESEDLWYALNAEPEKRLVDFIRSLASTYDKFTERHFDTKFHIQTALEFLLSLPEDYQRDQTKRDPFLKLKENLDRHKTGSGLQGDPMLAPLSYLDDLVFRVAKTLTHSDELFDTHDFPMLLWRAVMALFKEAASGRAPRNHEDLPIAAEDVANTGRLFDLLHLYTVEIADRMEKYGIVEKVVSVPRTTLVPVVLQSALMPPWNGHANGTRPMLQHFTKQLSIVFQELIAHLSKQHNPRLRGTKERSTS